MKIYIKALLLIILLIFFALPKSVYAAEQVKLGDANLNGTINNEDVLLIARHIYSKSANKRLEWILKDDKYKAADTDKNGIINSSDLILVLRYIAAYNSSDVIGKKHPEWLNLGTIDLNKDPVSEKIEVTGISLDKENAELDLSGNKALKLNATITPANATDKSIKWTVNYTSIATVDTNGTVTAKANGTVTVKATTTNRKIAKCIIKVKTSPNSLKLNKTTLSLNTGKSERLIATLEPKTVTEKNITWTSSNGNIASVDKNGKITAKKVGNITITAKTSNGKTAKCTVKVGKTIKVTFYANGGNGGGTQKFTYGVKNQKFNIKVSRTGYTFSKWNTKANGKGTSYSYKNAVSDSFINKSSSEVKLYAIWKANSYKNGTLYGADPWVYRKGNYYYYIVSTGSSIKIYKTTLLNKLTQSGGKVVYSGGSIWAPELHFINNRWYIYAAIQYDSNERSRRMYVFESKNADPFSKYTRVGQLNTGGWAIDGTVLQHNKKLYFIWSGWPGSYNGRQNLYIASMSSPKHISGSRVLISSPSQHWETLDTNPYVNEGPQVLKHNNKVFIVYSANGSWYKRYCLGMLTLNGSNPLKSSSWKKTNGAVFSSGNGVYGPGHACFVKSPDGMEDWIIYHGNTNPNTPSGNRWWDERKVFMKKFTWNKNGTPNFGKPLSPSKSLNPPSGTK